MNHLADQLISQLLDGTLDASASASARAHLTTCATCRTRFAFAGAVDRAVKTSPRIEPRAGFTVDVMRSIVPAAVAPVRRNMPVNIPALMMAACFLIAIIVAITAGVSGSGSVQPLLPAMGGFARDLSDGILGASQSYASFVSTQSGIVFLGIALIAASAGIVNYFMPRRAQ